MPGDGGISSRRRKLFALRDEIGLTRQDLLEIAEVILWHDVLSTDDLDEHDVNRLLDALEGYVKVSHLLRMR